MPSQSVSQTFQGRITLIFLPQINLRKIRIPALILIAALVVFYIFQISEITRASFLASQYEERVLLMTQENKNLEFGFSQMNSLINLETLLKQFPYQSAGEIQYIRVLDGTVLAK